MIYKNIVNLLKSKVNSPFYNIGNFLPAEKELVEFYDVPCNTLCKALKTLEEDDLIERRHGSRIWIRNKHFQTSMAHLDSFTEIAHNQGKTPSSQILKLELQPASEEIARGLQLQHDEAACYAKRLRFIDNIAMQLEETWLSATRFPDLTIAHMKKSKLSYIENECGVRINGCYESIVPVLPTPGLTTLLYVSTKDPIICMQTQATDEHHQPIDCSILYTNMLEFQVKYYLSRQTTSGLPAGKAGQQLDPGGEKR